MNNWNYEKDFPVFVKIMTGVATLLRVPLLSEEEMEIYYKYLSTKFDSVIEFSKAADLLIENADKVFDSRKEFPRATSFLQFKDMSIDEKEIELIAIDAWNVALDTAIIYGERVNPAFNDIIINNTINKMGGWREFCTRVSYSITNEDLRRRDKAKDEFLKIYKNLALTGRIRNEKLVGVGNVPKAIDLPYTPLKMQNMIENKMSNNENVDNKIKQLANLKKI